MQTPVACDHDDGQMQNPINTPLYYYSGRAYVGKEQWEVDVMGIKHSHNLTISS